MIFTFIILSIIYIVPFIWLFKWLNIFTHWVLGQSKVYYKFFVLGLDITREICIPLVILNLLP